MTHYVKNKVQSGVKGRKSYSSMMTPTFLDPKTGNFKQLNQSPWFLKMKNGKPGYLLYLRLYPQHTSVLRSNKNSSMIELLSQPYLNP